LFEVYEELLGGVGISGDTCVADVHDQLKRVSVVGDQVSPFEWRAEAG
jgi:uncharacterized protein GlcG (DUF336 family)